MWYSRFQSKTKENLELSYYIIMRQWTNRSQDSRHPAYIILVILTLEEVSKIKHLSSFYLNSIYKRF